MAIRSEWDPSKAAANRREHKVSFGTAMRVFSGPLALARQDRIEGGEHRWTTTGLVDGQVLLVVARTLRDDGEIEVIRIISARRAEPEERRRYEQPDR
jgi:uncharacterized DUF497 family protein